MAPTQGFSLRLDAARRSQPYMAPTQGFVLRFAAATRSQTRPTLGFPLGSDLAKPSQGAS
jgi:hypothetical protein